MRPVRRLQNLGTGRGHSVREVIDTVERVTGRKVPHKIGLRRPGDPAVLVADAGLAQDVLGWKPEMPGLEEMVQTASSWVKPSYQEPPI